MSILTATKFPTCENPYTGKETLLRHIFIELMKQNASDGMKQVGAGETYDGDFYGFIPREDTIVGMLRCDVDDVRDDYGIVGVTLTTSDPAIMAQMTNPFTSITVTSGSVWVLKML